MFPLAIFLITAFIPIMKFWPLIFVFSRDIPLSDSFRIFLQNKSNLDLNERVSVSFKATLNINKFLFIFYFTFYIQKGWQSRTL